MQAIDIDLKLTLDRFQLEIAFSSKAFVTGIFGPSGSGKTSILECIAGIRKNARGSIALNGNSWLDSHAKVFAKPEQRRIGYVPQDSLLFPHKNVKQNLLAGTQAVNQEGAKELYPNVVDILEIHDLLDRNIHELSGGETQRVALGRAICSNPQLLLLDEPLASIDIRLRHKIMPFLQRIRKEFSIPIILVSHNPVEVQALCDELIVINNGKMVSQGPPLSVLTKPSVFPIASQEGFENILRCKVIQHAMYTSTLAPLPISQSSDPQQLTLVGPKTEHPIDSECTIGISANDIIIANTSPSGISARNLIPATISEIQQINNIVLIHARISEHHPSIVVELTPESVNELAIGKNKRIFLLIKSNSIKILG